MTPNTERVTHFAKVVTKTNAILNNGNTNTWGLKVNTEINRTKGEQRADPNMNTEGLRVNTEKRNI